MVFLHRIFGTSLQGWLEKSFGVKYYLKSLLSAQWKMALYKVKVSAYSRTCIANICSDIKSATKRMRARIFELAILNCDFISATRFITIRKGAREIDIRSIFHSIFFFFRFDVTHNQDSTFGIKYDLLIEVSIAENINFATLRALKYSCGYREKYRMTFVRVIKM